MAGMIDSYKNKVYGLPAFVINDIFSYFFYRYDGDDYKIYDKEYFYTYSYMQQFSEEYITEHTYAIHWWQSSWLNNDKVLPLLKEIKATKK